MLEAGFVIFRFSHYLAVSALFGIALFPLYGYSSRAVELPARLTSWRDRALLSSAIGCLLTGILWLAFTTANMSGELRAALDPAALRTVIHNTGFGHLWILRLALSVAAVAAAAVGIIRAKVHRNDTALLLIAGALLATLAGTGHTQVDGGVSAAVHTLVDASHLLAAGAWIGGLIVLSFLLSSSLPGIDVTLQRFSGMGYIAVAVLLASGVANSWFLVGSVSRLTTTTYGQLLLIKICLFGGMLVLAAINRFLLVPSLINGNHNSSLSLAQLRRHVLGEQILGVLVLLIVSVLGTVEPAMSQF